MRGMVYSQPSQSFSSPAQKNPSGLEETHAGMASWYILTREAAHCWRFACMNTSVLTGRRRLKNSLVILSVASRCRSSDPRLSATSLLQQAFKGTDNWEYNKASSKVSFKRASFEGAQAWNLGLFAHPNLLCINHWDFFFGCLALLLLANFCCAYATSPWAYTVYFTKSWISG